MMRPVDCEACGNQVLVHKNRLAHTVIQWTSSTAACEELALRAAMGETPALVRTCTKLRESIENAVTQGRLEVDDA